MQSRPEAGPPIHMRPSAGRRNAEMDGVGVAKFYYMGGGLRADGGLAVAVSPLAVALGIGGALGARLDTFLSTAVSASGAIVMSSLGLAGSQSIAAHASAPLASSAYLSSALSAAGLFTSPGTVAGALAMAVEATLAQSQVDGGLAVAYPAPGAGQAPGLDAVSVAGGAGAGATAQGSIAAQVAGPGAGTNLPEQALAAAYPLPAIAGAASGAYGATYVGPGAGAAGAGALASAYAGPGAGASVPVGVLAAVAPAGGAAAAQAGSAAIAAQNRDATNLVVNPSFAAYTTNPGAPDDWTVQNGTAAQEAQETSIVHRTRTSLKLTMPGSPSAQGPKQALPPLTAGLTYYVAAWTRTSGGTARGLLRLHNITDNSDLDVRGVQGSTTWAEVTSSFVAVAGKSYDVRVFAEAVGAAGDIVYFTDVYVGVVPSINPATNDLGPSTMPSGLLGVSHPNGSPSNLLLNPGFETYTTSPGAPDNWSVNGNVTLTKETAIVHCGVQACRMTRITNALSTPGVGQTVAGLSAGVDYWFQAWVYAASTATQRAQLIVTDSGGTTLASIASAALPLGVWTLIYLKLNVGSVPNKFFVTHDGTGATAGDVLIADCAFLSTSPPNLGAQATAIIVPAIAGAASAAQSQSGSILATQTITTPGTTAWVAPAGVTSVQVELWGAGGGGGTASTFGGGGGGGGAYSKKSVTVTPGNSYNVVVPAAPAHDADGSDATFNATDVVAKGGTKGAAGGGGIGGAGGAGGTAAASTGTTKFGGGTGGTGALGGGGGGGGGAGNAGNGGTGGNGSAGVGGAAGAAGTAGGGAGGLGGTSSVNAAPGVAPAGGGAGSGTSGNNGGAGGAGKAILVYTIPI